MVSGFICTIILSFAVRGVFEMISAAKVLNEERAKLGFSECLG